MRGIAAGRRRRAHQLVGALVVGLVGVVATAVPVWAAATYQLGIPATFAPGVQNAIPDDWFTDVSCASAGNCTAVGVFLDDDGNRQVFTQTSTNGVWALAVPVAFADGVQSAAPDDELRSVSCASAGNCTAAGSFVDAEGSYRPFTQTSTNGVWAPVVLATFAPTVENASPIAWFSAVSCATAGNCTAGGSFLDVDGDYQTFTQTSTDGVWATSVPVTFAEGAQSTDPDDRINSVSCSSPGNCTAVGGFVDGDGFYQAFTRTSTNGVWAHGVRATFAPGVQDPAPEDGFSSVSCVSPGNCTAVGSFSAASGAYLPFAQTSTNGVWADGVPTTFDTVVMHGIFDSVSCVSAGNCTAVGYFEDENEHVRAFTQTSTNGVWSPAVPVAFAAGVQNDAPDARLNAVSCVPSGGCTVAGGFVDVNGHYLAFTQQISLPTLPPTGADLPWLLALAALLLGGGAMLVVATRTANGLVAAPHEFVVHPRRTRRN